MNRQLSFALFASLITLLLTSCGSVTQEVWVNADGSGRMEYSYDMSEMAPMLAMMPAEELGDINSPEGKIMSLFMRDRVDSTFPMRDMLPDSVRQMFGDRASLREQLTARTGTPPTEEELDRAAEGARNLEQMQLMIHVDKQAQELEMGMRVDFTKQEGVAGATQKMTGIQALQGQNSAPAAAPYSLVGKTFQIRISAAAAVEQMRTALAAQAGGAEMTEATIMETMESAGMSELSVVVHLPGEIKSVTGATSVALDDNSVLIKIPMLSVIRDKKDFNADIKFKSKKKYARTVPM